MCEYADEAIDAGMNKEPFGGSGRRRVRWHGKPVVKKPAPMSPPKISDDHFTLWFDELQSTAGFDGMSMYEVENLAWMEVVKRMTERGGR